jgi:hypothetical protein
MEWELKLETSHKVLQNYLPVGLPPNWCNQTLVYGENFPK